MCKESRAFYYLACKLWDRFLKRCSPPLHSWYHSKWGGGGVVAMQNIIFYANFNILIIVLIERVNFLGGSPVELNVYEVFVTVNFKNFTHAETLLNGTKYSRMDEVKFVEDSLFPSSFLKDVFHKFYLVHSWIICPKCIYCMFWYLKYWASVEWSILFNKTSLCSKVWFVGPRLFLFKTEDNYVTQGWKNLKFFSANILVEIFVAYVHQYKRCISWDRFQKSCFI